MKKLVWLAAAIIIAGCTRPSPTDLIPTTSTSMRLTSPDFYDRGSLPSRFTCDSGDATPILNIGEVPTEAKSLALIVDDPDAPGGDFVHWLVWNIPSTATELTTPVPTGAVEGTTGFGAVGYGGPCPPSGTHRYYFKLYALDLALDLPTTATKTALEQAMSGHVLAHTQLMGTYQRSR